MATNNMTPEQDLLTREFFRQIVQNNSLFPTDPASQRAMAGAVLQLLNYDYVGGAYVQKGEQRSRPFSGQQDLICEWAADEQRSMEALNETNQGTSTPEAYSGEQATDTEVRQAVLREDV